MLLVLAIVVTSALIGASFEMIDTDLWQHLLVAKLIWTQHRIPHTNEFTWPTFGAPLVLPSWGFRALLWPFWALGGPTGLTVWRWGTTLAAFALLWRVARRIGARGFAALATIAWCVLVYRHRIYVRPETLVAVMLAATLWILETRREGGRDHTWWLVPLAWAWINIHISWWMLFAVVGAHLVEDLLVPPRRGLRLLWVLLAAAAVSFVNPFGWRLIAEPFAYAFQWRNELMFRTIGELQPVDWKFIARTGFIALLPLWPLLIILRAQMGGARRAGWDLAELLTCVGFSALGLWNQRFVSTWAVVAAPYLARGAATVASTIRWPRALRAPWPRAAIAALVIVAGSLPEWSRADMPIGTRVLPESYPAGACDFMAAHGIRGPGFNHFEFGGYLLWRFWPERDRLPFLDIHLTGDTEDVRLAGLMLNHADAWQALERRYEFRWALLRRLHSLGDVSLDIVEADSSWALVFLDDAAALYVPRAGAYAGLADSLAFHIVRAGRAGMAQMGRVIAADTTQRVALRNELERMIASSPRHSGACSMLAELDLVEGRWQDAIDQLREGRRLDPRVPHYHDRVGLALMRMGRMAEARVELERAAHDDRTASSWALLARARAASGDRAGAQQAAREALRLDPGADVSGIP
jgi:hypothetical protein